MTQILKTAFERLVALPEVEQDIFAERILAELEGAISEDTPSGFQWIGGRKPSQEETNKAIARNQALRQGVFLGKETTLRDLIDEGRRF
jgi:hypothetical protein